MKTTLYFKVFPFTKGKMNITYCCAVLVLLFLSTTSFAQENYTVKGKVLDEQSVPLNGVNVVLKNSDQGVVTDINGNFTFLKPLQVDDVLVFSYLGYEPKEFRVNPQNTKELEITIQFEASDVILMGAVNTNQLFSSTKTKQN